MSFSMTGLETYNVVIDAFFQNHLSLSQEDAYDLHIKYYKQYGLAIEGLVRHHQINALEFNAKVDDALPLEEVLKPDPDLRRLFEDVDREKVTLWLLTNAYVTHGKRVVRLLGIDDLFDGITYCDYAEEQIIAKPQKQFFEKGMKDAGVNDFADCYLVGKSATVEASHSAKYSS
jgi:pyrimidine and pyridine-specific 5'-nucleotidase